MNVLFLSLSSFDSLNDHGIYTDLLKVFVKNGHNVSIISPIERRYKIKTHMIENENNVRILRLQIGNIQKTNFVEKGISTISIKSLFIKSIKRYFSDCKFDLILYATPPITFIGAVKYVKKKYGAKTYLLLKDIFPQNAIDLGVLNKNGIKGVLYKYFRKQEKELYRLSDYIGCMSQANIDYVINHNPEISIDKVELCPNSIEIVDECIDSITRNRIRTKYGIPTNKKVFVYGGNLGMPQGIDFLIQCISGQRDNEDVFFLIIGDGTDYTKLERYYKQDKQSNFMLLKRIAKNEYDILIASCDVGMIFLDHRFTIPNFPSRLLGYMQAKIPVLACTDINTDVGSVIINGGFGYWCESNNVDAFNYIINRMMKSDMKTMGINAYNYLINNYSAEISYNIILNRVS